MPSYLRHTKNKALNNVVARVAPKNRTYCKSLSLPAQVALVVGQTNSSFGTLWKHCIQQGFGIALSRSQKKFFDRKDKLFKRHRDYHKKHSAQLRRVKRNVKKMKD